MRFLLYDFYYNNKDDYKMLKDEKYLNMMTNCTIWIYKLCKHYGFFLSVNPILLSNACLLIAYDLMVNNCDSFTGEIRESFRLCLRTLYT